MVMRCVNDGSCKVLMDCVDNNANVRCDCAGVENCELDSQQNELKERDQAHSVFPKLRGKCTVPYVSHDFFGCWQFEFTMQWPMVDTSIHFERIESIQQGTGSVRIFNLESS